MRLLRPACLLLIVTFLATGCRSRVISIRLVNESPQPVSMIVVDYPAATFGVNSLAPGKTFQYRFKPVDTGALKIQFTNSQGVVHKVTGPTVAKNQEGSMEIKFTQDSATVRTLAQ
jgi:hypothetical protein